MSGVIVNFPQHYEVKKLMIEHNLAENDFSSEKLTEIEQAISAVRRTHGLFEPRHFNALITLLNHDWLPEDIPVLLPEPSLFNTIV